MKRFFKSHSSWYALSLVGLGLFIIAVLALIGPATGNVFSNIYTNMKTLPTHPSAENNAAPNARATPASAVKSSGVLASPYRANRLIIKNAEVNLLVTDTERAIDQIINLAVSSGGYVIGERSWMENGLKFATLTIGVPSDQFESVQRQVRASGAQVLSATSSGQDVSDEYVDLEARQRNLEATAARIREFLSQTKDAEQALLVNAKLSEVEAEIEQIKGRRAYLQDRSAYSTMTINLEPQRPTPSPTPTATPAAWLPEKTFNSATGALSNVLHGLGDAAIWLVAFVAPLAIPVAAVALGVMWVRRRRAKRVMQNASHGEVSQ